MNDERPAAPRGWPAPRAVAIGLAASAAIGGLAYRRGSLSRGGVAGAILTGTTIFAAGGPVPSALLITFFISSSALSHWRRGRKAAVEVQAAKGARRDLAQTLANGGVATIAVVWGRVSPAAPWFPALLGALATTNADTWATELGLLNRRPPRLITTGRTVPPGTSGGVSPLGTAAAALGAAAIGGVATMGVWLSSKEAAGRHLPVALLSGLLGACTDSILGATVQARYWCPHCSVITESPIHRCGRMSVHTGGFRVIDNDLVNFLAALCGACYAIGVARALEGRHHE